MNRFKRIRFQARIILFLGVTLFHCISSQSQEYKLALYPGTIPDSKPSNAKETVEKTDITLIRQVEVPEIAVYLPSKRFATGQAVIICPGGGYWVLAYDLEGTDIARYLNSIGVAAMVLKYRLPTAGNTLIQWKAPLMDAQRAMRLVRSHAKDWNVDSHKIGIMGFSAGGHLASTLGTHFDYGNPHALDSVEMQSCRPDFMILVYAAISLTDSCAPKGSGESLLGRDPKAGLLNYFSNELQVKADGPPAFILHANNDDGVPAENAILFYKALRAKHIPVELHILSEGDHGFGLAVSNPHVHNWVNDLKLWLEWLNQAKPLESKQ